jgi:hypothetical protein
VSAFLLHMLNHMLVIGMWHAALYFGRPVQFGHFEFSMTFDVCGAVNPSSARSPSGEMQALGLCWSAKHHFLGVTWGGESIAFCSTAAHGRFNVAKGNQMSSVQVDCDSGRAGFAQIWEEGKAIEAVVGIRTFAAFRSFCSDTNKVEAVKLRLCEPLIREKVEHGVICASGERPFQIHRWRSRLLV